MGRLKKPSPPFRLPIVALKLAVGVEDEHLARLRIGHVDVVLGIDGDALRRQHGIFALFDARQELVLLLLEIEDVDPVGAGVGHDDAPARIGGDAVRTDQAVEFRFAGNEVEHLLPEGPLGLHFARGVEAALVGQLAAAQQLHLGRSRLRCDLLSFFFRRRRPRCQQHQGDDYDLECLPQQSRTRPIRKS